MKTVIAFFALLFFSHAASALSSGFVPHSELDFKEELQLWVEGSGLPSGAEWLVGPETGKTNPDPAIGRSYMIIDAAQKASANYFLGAWQSIPFDRETVFVVWVFVEEKPEYISVSFHEAQLGWKGVFFGSRKETARLKPVSKKLPAEGEWHAFFLSAAEIFPAAGEGSIDGFAVETSNGKILVDSVAIASSFSIPLDAIPEISVEASKKNFLKGETMAIAGRSSGEALVTAFSGNREIFSETIVPDANKNFSLVYNIGFSDPSGEWVVYASTPFKEVSEKIVVSADNSKLLEVNFLSPVAAHFEKNSVVSIVAKVSLLGNPVDNAVVDVWGVFGERVRLENTGNGAYSIPYRVPFHAPEGTWELLAVAANEKNLSGEAKIRLGVLELNPKIELIEPWSGKFSFGQPLVVRIKAYYPEDIPASDASAKIVLNMPVENSNVLTLRGTGNGLFETVLPTTLFSNKPLEMKVVLATGIEKTVQQDFQLLPDSYLFNFLKANVFFLAFPLVILAIGAIVWVSRLKPKSSQEKLLQKKKSILGDLKKLEHDYYKKNLLSGNEFREKKLAIKSKIDSIDISLKTTKKQN